MRHCRRQKRLDKSTTRKSIYWTTWSVCLSDAGSIWNVQTKQCHCRITTSPFSDSAVLPKSKTTTSLFSESQFLSRIAFPSRVHGRLEAWPVDYPGSVAKWFGEEGERYYVLVYGYSTVESGDFKLNITEITSVEN